jgi:methenyltetrahydrofolate cyclohydrolase
MEDRMDTAGRASDSVESFLDGLASDRPTPGGGAAGALTGAAAAALVGMVCRVTARHVPSEKIMMSAIERSDALRVQFRKLIHDDIQAYEAFLDARRVSRDPRGPREQAALQRATLVPVEIARAAASVLELCASVVEVVRVSTVGDLAVAAALAAAVVESSSLTARINLRDIIDRHFIEKATEDLDAVERAAATRREITGRVNARTGLEKLV